MKSKLRIACAALLVLAATPALALQLGQIQVKSALNQPLVAVIPLHPKNLNELDGLTVGLAPAVDFARAGLKITPTDQTLRFNLTTDNNGQKLLLVTSTQPITDPYLDFLLQVNTREGKQVREFVVLLNPLIAAPAPAVQGAPIASTPAASAPVISTQPAQLPPPASFPQPAAQAPAKPVAPVPQPVAASPPVPVAQPSQAAATTSGGSIPVVHGDTLYGIARQQTAGTSVSINQMMLALQATNPDAFFKHNIGDLKAGAILRIPTRDQIDQTSVAEANAEVHRQYVAWRAARPHPATVVAGTAAAAAAKAAPKPGRAAHASDHLTLVPPTGRGGSASNRPGVAGGTGTETVAGLQRQLQDDKGALVSLKQSNADLASRVHSLKDISSKTDKLLSLKAAMAAELQRKLAAKQAGKAAASGAATMPTAKVVTAPAKAGAKAATKPVALHAARTSWLDRPVTWIVAGVIVLVLIVLGLLSRRRGGAAPVVTKGPLPDPEDIASPQPEASDEEAALRAELAGNPDDLAVHLDLCRLYYRRGDTPHFVEAAQAMRVHVTDLEGKEWREVAVMGEELAPHSPLFKMPAETQDAAHGTANAGPHQEGEVAAAPAPAPHQPESDHERDTVLASASTEQIAAKAEPTPQPAGEVDPEATVLAGTDPESAPEFTDDPVDTKLDLARAYLDMGDPVGARAMLEEVLEEGSQTQKDVARNLLADVTG